MSKHHNISPTRISSLFQVQEKLKSCWSLKLNFSRSYFIADDSHVKHVVVFSKYKSPSKLL